MGRPDGWFWRKLRASGGNFWSEEISRPEGGWRIFFDFCLKKRYQVGGNQPPGGRPEEIFEIFPKKKGIKQEEISRPEGGRRKILLWSEEIFRFLSKKKVMF